MQIYDSAIAEAQLLHSREPGCPQRASDALSFSIFRKTGGRPSQRSYRLSQLETVVAATAGADDTYLSQSSFYGFGRQLVNFKQTRSAWVDLDLYNIDRTLDAATVNDIFKHGESLGIPPPTVVISSGRGCNLKWLFEVPVNQTQLLVWQALQATLTAAYSSLAADFKARDASRVFRLLDTKNSKSGQTVKVIDGCYKLYDFGQLCTAVESLRSDLLIDGADRLEKRIATLSDRAPILQSSLSSAQRGNAQELVLYSELNHPIMMEARSERSLNFARFCDLRDLFVARGGIAVGERDQALLWMLNFLAHAGVINSLNWEKEMCELLRAFPQRESFDPLKDGSMGTLFQRLKDKESNKKYKFRGVDVDPLYRASNDFLIKTFGIKPFEMSSLSTIISLDEKRRRVDVKHEGRAQRRDARNSWRFEVQAVYAALTPPAITLITSDPAAHSTSINPFADSPTSVIDAVSTGVVSQGISGKPGAINVSALAGRLGVERTRVSRYLAMLQRQIPDEVKKAARKKTPNYVQKDAQGLANDCVEQSVPDASVELQETEAQRVLRAQRMFEASRLAKIARQQAVAAREAAQRLAIQGRITQIQERWALKKVLDVIEPQEFAATEEATMASDNLFKKMALLNMAQGKPAPVTPIINTGGVADELPAVQASPVQTELSAPSTATSATSHAEQVAAAPAKLSARERLSAASRSNGFRPAGVSRPAVASMPAKSPVMTPAKPAAPAMDVRSEASAYSEDSDDGWFARMSEEAEGGSSRQVVAKTAPAAPVARTVQAPTSIPVATPIAPIAVKAPVVFVAPSPAPVPVRTSAAGLSAKERIRAAAERGSSLPPLQRASKGSGSKKQLVEGGPSAPEAYPSVQEWESNTIPPGSKYSEQDWALARKDPATGAEFAVIEYQVAEKTWLMQIPKAYDKEVVVSMSKREGVVKRFERVSPQDLDPIADLTGQIYSDCIFVSPDAFPQFPGAAEVKCIHDEAAYHVIRARADYTDPTRFFRVGAVLKVQTTKDEDVSNISHEHDSATNNSPKG